MKNFINKFKWFLLGSISFTGVLVFAAQISVPSAGGPGFILQSQTGGTYLPVSLTAGTNVTISTSTTNITISSSGGGSSFPFTVNPNYNSTSTVIGFNGLFSTASSTFSGPFMLSALGVGQLNIGVNGLVYSAASTTFSGGLTYSSGNVTCTGCGATGNPDLIYLTLSNTAFYAASSTNSDNKSWLFRNGFVSNASSTFSSNVLLPFLSQGNLYTGSNGLVQTTGTSTPTVTAPITYSGTLGDFMKGASGAFGCTNASSGVTGCLTGTDWNTFNNKQPSLVGAFAANSVITSDSNGTLQATGTQLTVGNILATTTADNIFRGRLVFPYGSSTSYSTFVTASSTNLFLGTGQGSLYVGSGQAVGVIATTTVTNGTGISLSANAGALLGGSNLTITNTGVISGSCSGGTTCSGTNPLTISSFSYPFTPTNYFATGMFTQATTSTLQSAGMAISSTSDPIANLGGVAGGGQYPLIIANPTTVTGSSTGIGFQITNSPGPGGWGIIGAGIIFIRQGASSFGDLTFATTPSGGNNTRRMTITSDGFVGVATTTPQGMLTVSSSTAPQIYFSSGAGFGQIAMRNDGTSFYLSSTTVTGTATTSTSMLEIALGGFGTTTIRGLNISGQATSTSNVGFNITTGCYAISNICISGSGGGGTLTALGDGWATTTGTVVTHSTTTSTTNGLTSALKITTTASALTFTPSLSGVLSEAGGGTNQSTYTAGDLLYASAANTLSKRGATTNGFVLALSNGLPTWVATSSINNGVTSVGLSLPSFFTVTNSPVTTTGTLTGAFSKPSNALIGLTAAGTDFVATGTPQLTIGNLLATSTVANTLFLNNWLGVGTSTPQYLLTLASSTVPQLSLSSGAGVNQWAFRVDNAGSLTLSTTTVTGTATTSVSALTLFANPTCTSCMTIGTSAPMITLKNGSFSLGGGGDAQGNTGSTTISGAKMQFDSMDSAGVRRCSFVNNAGTFVTVAGACTP